MAFNLTGEQEEKRRSFRDFVSTEILPHTDCFDREERIDDDTIARIAAEGYLGAIIPQAYGGMGMDRITFGLLNEEIGKACTSVRSLITVQSMVSSVIVRWGTEEQKSSYLPCLARGEKIAAFALTEPDYGSDAANIKTSVADHGGSYLINGKKKWISFGQIADVFLAFGQDNGRLCAFLIERNTTGLSVQPIRGLLGVRGSMLAGIEFDGCLVSAGNRVGGEGFGLNPVAHTGIDTGRYSIAWGCVGMAQSCVDASIQYTRSRKQFGVYLKEHQLIRKMITDMMVKTEAARLLCFQAGLSHETGSPSSVREIMMAKYFASQVAVKVAGDAVQVHGANGCSRDFSVERFYRDAKIMEIIEGSDQMLQMMISRYGYMENE